MGKKVLGISASPRKGGNSDLLCDQFMLGAKEAGNQTEKVFLKGHCAFPDRVNDFLDLAQRCRWIYFWLSEMGGKYNV